MPRNTDIDDTPRKRRRTERYSNPDVIDNFRHTMYSFAPSPHSQPLRPRNGLSQIGAKKLVVKNLKQHAQFDHKAYADKAWKQLDTALTDIFAGSTTINKEELYRLVENVCRQGEASQLYNQLDNRCRQHVNDVLRSIDLDQEPVTLLNQVLKAWRAWKEHMHIIHSVFYFLDRSYLLASSKLKLAEMTPKFFRDIIFSDDDLQTRVIDGVCQVVEAERLQDRSGVSGQSESVSGLLSGKSEGVSNGLPAQNGSAPDDTLKQAIAMFVELSIYSSSFEPRYLETSQAYAREWSNQKMESVPQYVDAAETLINREMHRCDGYGLSVNTKRDLLSILEDDLIVAKLQYLADDTALASLLDSKDIAQLTALYSLLDRKHLGDNLRPPFEKWVATTGTSIVLADSSDDMVIRLLSLQQYLDTVWRSAFKGNETIGHGLRECFESFMNKTKKGDATWGTDNTKVGEMIAKYVDSLLRGGAKAIPDLVRPDDDDDDDTEISKQLDQVLDLFRFVHGKAVFEAFYKKDLAKRLLMARSASADAERSMLTRLRTECGATFTQNLEQMFKDIELGRDEMQTYKQLIEERLGHEKGALDLNVNVLSAAAWPTYPDVPVVIPPNIKNALDDFELHYKNKHSGRKIDWKHSLAHCQLRATFPNGVKELVVSSFQAVVLLLFNAENLDTHLTYTHILSETGLPEAEVKRTLQSLACAKLQPLTKHPRGREINDTDTFTINANFTHPRYRIKINQVQLKETKEENKETHIRVAEDRNFECQAAIVRIMKSRKTIGHSELISEVIKATMTRGVLAVADIKKNIDRLIEKDYMEREDAGYSYVA